MPAFKGAAQQIIASVGPTSGRLPANAEPLLEPVPLLLLEYRRKEIRNSYDLLGRVPLLGLLALGKGAYESFVVQYVVDLMRVH